MKKMIDFNFLWLRCACRISGRPILAALLCGTIMLGTSAMASAATSEDEVRDVFIQFMAAQNAHDATAVKALLSSSPDVLWFTRGVEVRGEKAIAETLADYYKGTWHLEPDMSAFHATNIDIGVAQILVPISFTRGLPGKSAQSNTFLICQTLVHTEKGWRVASILPIANTQFK